MAPRIPRIPKRIERWRGRRWQAILRAETVVGHSLQLMKSIKSEIREINERKARGRLSPFVLQNKTRGILLGISELADELKEADLEKRKKARLAGRRFQSRPKTKQQFYRLLLQQFWKQFPVELQSEIIRQSKEE